MQQFGVRAEFKLPESLSLPDSQAIQINQISLNQENLNSHVWKMNSNLIKLINEYFEKINSLNRTDFITEKDTTKIRQNTSCNYI